MRNASGLQGENERKCKKKKNVDNNTYDISSIKRVTRNSKFLEVSTFSGKNRPKDWVGGVIGTNIFGVLGANFLSFKGMTLKLIQATILDSRKILE